MEPILEVLFFVIGLVVLLKGASLFTENAGTIARRMGVSEILIGLTLVAFATSLPELSVSVLSSVRGSPGIALGNVIGSNIANVGLVLGIAAFLTPGILVGRPEMKQAYVMLGITALASLFIIDGMTLIKGIILISLLFVYLFYLSRDVELKQNVISKIIERRSFGKAIVLCVIGAAGVMVGSELLIGSSINIARMFSVPEVVIGLTLVAVGTSLPELATSVMAAYKHLEGIALGNIIGSNVFNLLMVLGAASIAGGLVADAALITYSIPMMMLLTILLLIFMKIENRLDRRDGMSLLLIYALFIYTRFFLL